MPHMFIEAMSALESTRSRRNTTRLPALLTRAVWLTFLLSLLAAGRFALTGDGWTVGRALHVDGLTFVMWVTVAFFSGIVHSYSRRYLAANRDVELFFLRLSGFTVAVMAMTAANHVALFVVTWVAMGWLMGDLIGHVRGWEQARRAGRLAKAYFVSGGVLLALGLAVLAGQTGTATITGVLANLDAVTPTAGAVAAILLLAAAMIQSALFPAHGWLLSSMTAPTPASAIMHAGFVNAGGVLLARLAPVFAGHTSLMLAVAVAGGTSALLAQAWMLVQPDIKARLGCSTVAQMGFMILQAGLGFFAAAVTHLIVHGFYKAYMFLSSGARIEQQSASNPPSPGIEIPAPVRFVLTVLTAAGGGVLFAAITEKSLIAPETGLFLTVVIVLSVLHATRDLLGRTALSPTLRIVGVPLVLLPAMAVYGAVYNAVSGMMSALPMVHAPMALTPVHWALLALFVAGHAALEFGVHRRSNALYVWLLNQPQPAPSTVLTNKEEYDDH